MTSSAKELFYERRFKKDFPQYADWKYDRINTFCSRLAKFQIWQSKVKDDWAIESKTPDVFKEVFSADEWSQLIQRWEFVSTTLSKVGDEIKEKAKVRDAEISALREEAERKCESVFQEEPRLKVLRLNQTHLSVHEMVSILSWEDKTNSEYVSSKKERNEKISAMVTALQKRALSEIRDGTFKEENYYPEGK
jgi:hypothetical protein